MVTKNSGNHKSAAPAASPSPSAKAAEQGFSAKPQPSSEAPDLSATVSKLEAAIAQATVKEQQLEATIDELQSKITAQISTIQDLQAQVKQSQQIEAALEKAEAAARHLAVLNESLIAENADLKEKSTASTPQPPNPEVKTSSLATSRNRPSDPGNLMHPVFPNGALPSGMGDQEIGWFD